MDLCSLSAKAGAGSTNFFHMMQLPGSSFNAFSIAIA